MVAGHLQIKNGYYYMVLTFKLPDGSPSAKWKSTGLKAKGNKRKAEKMLLEFRRNFKYPEGDKGEKGTVPCLMGEWEGVTVPQIRGTERKVPTMEEYVLAYMQSIRNTILGATWETRMNFAKHIISGLGQYKVDELSRPIIRKFINDFAATPYIKNKKGEKAFYSQDSINKLLDLLKNVVDELLEAETLEKDITAKIKRPKSRRAYKAKNGALTTEEVNEVLGMVEDGLMLKVIIHMLLFLGIRPGELYALEWTDFDWHKKTVHITNTLSAEPIYSISGEKIGTRPIIKNIKNDNCVDDIAIRELSIPPILEAILDEWHRWINCNNKLYQLKKANGTTGFLFCNAKNGELAVPQYYLRRYKYLLQKNGYEYCDFNYYRFRHTFATKALKQGLDIKTVQMLLGDRDPKMVLKIYTNMNKVEILEAHSRFTSRYTEEIRGHIV